jgi:hypothetical protein
MPQTQKPFTGMIRAAIRPLGPLTYDAFLELAVDPESQYRPSRWLIQKLAKGEDIGVNPQVVAATSVPLQAVGNTPEDIWEAAACQFIGPRPFLDSGPLHDMDFDPIPDEHGSDIVVTTSRDVGNTTPAPRSREAILKRVRRIEAAQRAAAEQRDIP